MCFFKKELKKVDATGPCGLRLTVSFMELALSHRWQLARGVAAPPELRREVGLRG